MNNIAGLDLPHLNTDDRLRRILTAALPNHSDNSAQPSLDYWDAKFFNLHQVQIFQQATVSEQSAILQLTNRSIFLESYFIEKAGVGYMAKMVLLAETVEERMLYALFTADEATHLSQIVNFLPELEASHSKDPFVNLLAEVVESADKAVLLFVLQVVLEGWGLSHYRRLAKECHHPQLKELFASFLQAESRHHGTGTMLFNRYPVSASTQAAAIDILACFLSMIQVGPQSVLSAIEQVKGDLTRSQKIQIMTELDTQTHSGTRLEILRSLMHGKSAEAIVQALDERGAFTALPAYQCVF
ncbi:MULTISPECIES: ferritin-like domain-containing protein [Calothrix]|uniref:Ferritin-like domain-containing protein n=2 Tax=Calothrix TaxID=1186 RepID=A0ABR8AKA1_9CYAN|nr:MULTISPECIES: ferritin-like domain-containing protein [Calothrix]MBD2200416.1 ferritin-like domain-containing protein [Calothrix parietina FACHB-288]MBD2229387.1 ferritin-like domain-containing protein [Calothrix anomala FACHB-343]